MSEPVDGILGMSRDVAPPTDSSYEIGPLFVKELGAAGLTTNNVFSFYLEGPGITSFIDFSGFNPISVKGGSELSVVWLKLNDDFFWSSFCQGISFGKPGATDDIEDSP
jgi:hypothetical protein